MPWIILYQGFWKNARAFSEKIILGWFSFFVNFEYSECGCGEFCFFKISATFFVAQGGFYEITKRTHRGESNRLRGKTQAGKNLD